MNAVQDRWSQPRHRRKHCRRARPRVRALSSASAPTSTPSPAMSASSQPCTGLSGATNARGDGECVEQHPARDDAPLKAVMSAPAPRVDILVRLRPFRCRRQTWHRASDASGRPVDEPVVVNDGSARCRRGRTDELLLWLKLRLRDRSPRLDQTGCPDPLHRRDGVDRPIGSSTQRPRSAGLT